MRLPIDPTAWMMCAGTATVFAGCFHQEEVSKVSAPSVETSWQPYPAPTRGDRDWSCANWSSRRWAVSSTGGQLQITRQAPVTGPRQPDLPFPIEASDIGGEGGEYEGTRYLMGRSHVFRVSDGWLVGFDAGEWGGKLFWFSGDGSRFEEVFEHRVVSISAIDGRVLIFSSPHPEWHEGTVVEAYNTESGWTTRSFSTLPSSPLLSEPEGADSILLLLRSGLFRLHKNGSVEPLVAANFDGLYPSSFVRLDTGEVYIAMRHFVVVLTPTGGKWSTTWLVPSDCTKFELVGGECVCS